MTCSYTPESSTDAIRRVLLLQRSDIDTSVKDLEGYTAFDLYNSTVEGTKPDLDSPRLAGLYTWGANRSVHDLVIFGILG